MECSCLIDPDYESDYENDIKTKYIISKTAHVCTECGRKIPAGEKYLLEIATWEIGSDDQHTIRYKTCADCESIRDNLCCSFVFTTVLEDIENALYDMPSSEYPWAAFAKLTPRAREWVLDLIEKIWEEGDE